MIAIKSIVFIIVIFFMGVNVFSNDLSPDEILKEVADTYKTIKAEGTITNETEDSHGEKGGSKFFFSILFKKPNLYLITLTSIKAPPGHALFVTVWSDGTQPYLYNGITNSYAKITSDEMAFYIIRVMNGPELLYFPSLFLPTLSGQEEPFSWLKNPKIEKIEKIGEEDCYVISGSSGLYKREVLWVSKSRHLIRKYYYSLEPPEGWPGMTDENLKREKKGEEAWKRDKETDFHCEFYAEISSPELKKDDFVFALPEGAVRNDTRYELWGPIPPNYVFHGANR